jgi:peptide deformylase
LVKETPNADLKVFINPQIFEFKDLPEEKIKNKKLRAKSQKPNKGVQLEGCLSLKDIWGVVKRHDEVTVTYKDENDIKHTKTFDGFMSIIIQHETDHLNGILFPKRVLEQEQKLYKSFKNKKGEVEFEELSL